MTHRLTGVSGKNGSLNCGSIRDGLVGINRLVQFLPIEEILEKLLDLWDPGGASHQDQVVNARLVHLGVPHSFLHGFQSALEQVRAQLLKPAQKQLI